MRGGYGGMVRLGLRFLNQHPQLIFHHHALLQSINERQGAAVDILVAIARLIGVKGDLPSDVGASIEELGSEFLVDLERQAIIEAVEDPDAPPGLDDDSEYL
jgi:hypothetical protein